MGNNKYLSSDIIFSPQIFNQPWNSILLSNDATAQFINGLGIIFHHYIAVPNPIGEHNMGDLRRTFGIAEQNQFDGNSINKDFAYIENGFLYKCVGQIWGIFQGNSKKQNELPNGLYGAAGASLTINRYYRGRNDYVALSQFDKLIPCISGEQFFSVNFEKTTANLTGINRLQFKATKIEVLVDSNGVIYNEGSDFCLDCGNIVWMNTQNSNSPGIDRITGKGVLFSVRYRYKPYFYVQSMGHDIRISPTFNEVGEISPLAQDGNGDLLYPPGPITASIVSDWIYLDRRAVNDVQTNDSQIMADDGDNTGIR